MKNLRRLYFQMSQHTNKKELTCNLPSEKQEWFNDLCMSLNTGKTICRNKDRWSGPYVSLITLLNIRFVTFERISSGRLRFTNDSPMVQGLRAIFCCNILLRHGRR